MSFPEHLSQNGGTRPATRAVKLTKADDTDIANAPCRALAVGTAGTANLVMADGSVCADFPLQQGYNPICVKQVETGGTADDIWALF